MKPSSKGELPLLENSGVTVVKSLTHEFMVLVTDFDAPIFGIAQLYRDRADVENCFDELKNQWGWGGFTTKDMSRSQTMARLVALVYNWWSMFVGLVEPDKHAEAITSRPQLLHGVGRITQSGRQTTLTVTSTHQKAAQIQERQTWVGRFLAELRPIAEQLTQMDVWRLILSLLPIFKRPHHRHSLSLKPPSKRRSQLRFLGSRFTFIFSYVPSARLRFCTHVANVG